MLVVPGLAPATETDELRPESITVPFRALADENIPERFRLADHEFEYELRWRKLDSPRFQSGDITFPSPVETPHPRNNTVHCEYYAPRVAGKRPAVIVLHILGGDFALARLFCHALNQQGTAALLLKMPYYGPRRQPGVDRRMIDADPEHTVAGMTQAVLDIRRAAALLATRPEVEAERIGILGISLGGITAALATEMEPRLTSACYLLAGGDLAKIAAESQEFAREREKFRTAGGDTVAFGKVVDEIDPLRYGEMLQGRRILMINAKSDEVIPRSCTDALWEAAGRPKIVWYSGGHYSVMRHITAALHETSHFFSE